MSNIVADLEKMGMLALSPPCKLANKTTTLDILDFLSGGDIPSEIEVYGFPILNDVALHTHLCPDA